MEEFPGLRWSPEKPIQPYTEYTVSVEARQSTALELIGRSMTYASYICTPAKYGKLVLSLCHVLASHVIQFLF